jgi:hypothetical protein
MADREVLAAMLAQPGAMPQQPAPTNRGVLADLLAAARTGIGNAWNGPTSPITGGPMYDPNAAPVPTSGRQGIEQVRDEYMDPAKRGLGVNTVLGFTESPATVGRFPMKPGFNQATIGDTTVDYWSISCTPRRRCEAEARLARSCVSSWPRLTRPSCRLP